MDYLDFSKDCCRMMIKSSKNAVMMQRGCLYLNVIIALTQSYLVYYHPTTFSAICAGAIYGNVMWLTMLLLSVKQDLAIEKGRLVHLEKLNDDQNYQNAIQDFKRSKEHYDESVKLFYGEHAIQKHTNAAYHENKQPESESPKAEK